MRERRRKKKHAANRTFSSKTKQLNNAAHCCGVKSLNTPLNTISVNSSSSPELISHATRPFCSTTSSAVANPSRRKARLRFLSSSRWITLCADWIFFLTVRISVASDCFAEYWS
jgi:hypothetical protein